MKITDTGLDLSYFTFNGHSIHWRILWGDRDPCLGQLLSFSWRFQKICHQIIGWCSASGVCASLVWEILDPLLPLNCILSFSYLSHTIQKIYSKLGVPILWPVLIIRNKHNESEVACLPLMLLHLQSVFAPRWVHVHCTRPVYTKRQ